MKAICPILLLVIFLSVAVLESRAQTSFKKQDTYIVNLSNRDSSIKASIFYDKKEIEVKSDRYYAWYGNNRIISTQGGYEGRLLHGIYTSFYPDNNLKQKGSYKKGMRHREWISWYGNGSIREINNWKNGCREGKQRFYDEQGKLSCTSIYKKGKLNGSYVTYKEGKPETVKKYRKGVEIQKKVKKEEETGQKKERKKWKRWFRKKKERQGKPAPVMESETSKPAPPEKEKKPVPEKRKKETQKKGAKPGSSGTKEKPGTKAPARDSK